jgi:hypothetical protein
MSVISWGRQERFKFSACGSLNEFMPAPSAAVFAITYRKDPQNKPKAHTVLYFGETEDLSQQLSSVKRRVMDIFADDGGTPDELYVFVHEMAGSTKPQRSRVQERLVLEYQPQANHMNN